MVPYERVTAFDMYRIHFFDPWDDPGHASPALCTLSSKNSERRDIDSFISTAPHRESGNRARTRTSFIVTSAMLTVMYLW